MPWRTKRFLLHWFLERGQAVALWEKIMVSKQMTLRKINTPNFNGSWFYKIIVAKLDFMKIICPKTKGNGSKMFQMAEKKQVSKVIKNRSQESQVTKRDGEVYAEHLNMSGYVWWPTNPARKWDGVYTVTPISILSFSEWKKALWCLGKSW